MDLKEQAMNFITDMADPSVPMVKVYERVSAFDGILAYFLFKLLREKTLKPENKVTCERMIDLFATYDDIYGKASLPKEDRILEEWFEECYDIKNFLNNEQAYVDLIVDKIEG